MTGGHAGVFAGPPLSTRSASMTCDAYEAAQLPRRRRRRSPSGDETDNFLDKPAAFAVPPVTGGSE